MFKSPCDWLFEEDERMSQSRFWSQRSRSLWSSSLTLEQERKNWFGLAWLDYGLMHQLFVTTASTYGEGWGIAGHDRVPAVLGK